MSTKTITALVDGIVQQIEVEVTTSEEQITIEDRLNELEDKPIVSDGNFLVGNGTKDMYEMTPEDVLSHIDGVSVEFMTSTEFETMENHNENTLYFMSDSNNEYYTAVEIDEKIEEINGSIDNKSNINHNHDGIYDEKGSANTALESAKEYIDSAISDIAGNNHSHDNATINKDGFMSSIDKVKLDNVEDGANKTIIDSSLSDTSANPVENKIINDALANKVSLSRTINGHALSENIVLNANDVSAANINHNHIISDITNLQSTIDGINEELDGSIKGLSISGRTITYTKNDGTTGTVTTQDTNTDTKVTNTLATTTKAYVTGTTSSNTNTGTQVFDTGVYLDNVSGQLVATTFKGNLFGNADTATKATNDGNNNTITSTYETKSDASSKLAEAKSYADEIKDSLVNGAGTAYDTLLELGNLIDDNTDAIEALETVASGKQSTITGAATTITSNNLTTNRALVSNGSGKVAVSAVTSTELGYLDGVTSNIQTQLDGKSLSSHTHGNATTSSSGFMSSSDKTKLNGIATGANNYSLPTAGSTLGGVKTTSTVTSNSGYTACPIIGGVPYYKDTNSMYSLASFGVTATSTELNKLDGVTATTAELNVLDGITATTAELNYVDGVTSNIQTQLNGKALSGHGHNDATTSSSGFMSSSDKTKLNGIATGAEVNQNAFSYVKVGTTTISADSETDTLTLVAGNNITLTPDSNGDSVTIAATTTSYTHPNSGVSAGTYKSVTVNAQGHVTGGSNPTTLSGYGITDAAKASDLEDLADLVGNTAVSTQINNAVSGKANSTHYHSASDITSGSISMSRGGTGATNGATGLANLFNAGYTKISSYQYGTSFPSSASDGTLFFKEYSNNIDDYSTDLINAIILEAHPIGSIYMSTDSVSPALKWGGTWTQIKDTFLLAAGNTYSAGSTGGEASHTLTEGELPHITGRTPVNFVCHQGYDASEGALGYDYIGMAASMGSIESYYGKITLDFGGGQPHNNMPPYTTVYMWKRVE